MEPSMDDQDSPAISQSNSAMELGPMTQTNEPTTNDSAVVPMESNPIRSVSSSISSISPSVPPKSHRTKPSRTTSVPTLDRCRLPSQRGPFQYQCTRRRRRCSEAAQLKLSKSASAISPDQIDYAQSTWASSRRRDSSPFSDDSIVAEPMTVRDLDEPGDEKLAPHVLAHKRRKELRRTTRRLSEKIHTSNTITELEREQFSSESPWMQSRQGCSAWWARLRQWGFQKRNAMARALDAASYRLRLWWKEKNIESRFGSGVVSYFVLLRWLLLINILPLTGLWVCFVFIPQLVVKNSDIVAPLGNGSQLTSAVLKGCLDGLNVSVPPDRNTSAELFDFLTDLAKNSTETNVQWYDYILSFFTGTGWLENTELFIGDYSGKTPGNSYQIPLAYILVGGIFYLLSLIFLAVKMGVVYKQSYVEGFSTGARYPFFNYLFTAWDYSISSQPTATERKRIVKRHLEESLATFQTQKRAKTRSAKDLCRIWTIRIACNLLVIGMLIAAGAAIYYAAIVSIEAGVSQVGSFDFDMFIRQLAASLTISVFNILYPFLFERIVDSFENYSNKNYATYLTILRSITLRASGVIVLMATLLRQVQCSQKLLDCGTVIGKTSDEETVDNLFSFVEQEQECKLCWETYIGQEVYRLLLTDFLFDVASTWIYQSARNGISRLKCVKIKFFQQKSDFVLSKNIINLVYTQALIWIGAFFGPLIPLIGSIQLLILYYAKKGSLILNCRPPSKAYRASRTSLFFLLLLLITFFACLVPVGYAIVENQPSTVCGPFRGLDSIYDVITNQINKGPTWLQDVLDYIGSAAVVVPLVVFLCLLTFYFSSKSSAYKASIATLEDQLQMKGEDIKKLYESANKQISELMAGQENAN